VSCHGSCTLGSSDTANSHAGYLEARRLLLIGRLDESEQKLDALDLDALPQASRTGYWLVAVGIAIRGIRAEPARAALERASQAARETGSPRSWPRLGARLACSMLLPRADACRNVVRAQTMVVPLASRPVLFALVRSLAEAWPKDVSRENVDHVRLPGTPCR
jgi:hypothetical protein